MGLADILFKTGLVRRIEDAERLVGKMKAVGKNPTYEAMSAARGGLGRATSGKGKGFGDAKTVGRDADYLDPEVSDSFWDSGDMFDFVDAGTKNHPLLGALSNGALNVQKFAKKFPWVTESVVAPLAAGYMVTDRSEESPLDKFKRKTRDLLG